MALIFRNFLLIGIPGVVPSSEPGEKVLSTRRGEGI
jgi:hypothetical protein